MKNYLEIKDLSYSIQNELILNDISFNIKNILSPKYIVIQEFIDDNRNL